MFGRGEAADAGVPAVGLNQASIHSKIAVPSWGGVPGAGVEELALHRRPEGFDHGVVDAGGDPAHRSEEAGLPQALPEDPVRLPGGFNRSQAQDTMDPGSTGTQHASALAQASPATTASIAATTRGQVSPARRRMVWGDSDGLRWTAPRETSRSPGAQSPRSNRALNCRDS